MTALLVVVGAVAGAPLRYLTDLAVPSRPDSVFPWGTLAVNAGGSLVLGAVAGAVSGGGPGLVPPLARAGFSGGPSQFSTVGPVHLRPGGGRGGP